MEPRPIPPRNGWVYVDHDGALFRGFSSGHPQEVWSERETAWKPYTFEGPHKPVEWGMVITEAAATARTGAQQA